MGFVYIVHQNKRKHMSTEMSWQNICMIASLEEISKWIFEKNYEDLIPQTGKALYCFVSVD